MLGTSNVSRFLLHGHWWDLTALCLGSSFHGFSMGFPTIRDRYWSHGPVEIVDLPIDSMVDLSSSLCKRLPEGNAPILQTQQVISVTSMDIQVLPRLREGLLHLMYREQRAGIVATPQRCLPTHDWEWLKNHLEKWWNFGWFMIVLPALIFNYMLGR